LRNLPRNSAYVRSSADCNWNDASISIFYRPLVNSPPIFLIALSIISAPRPLLGGPGPLADPLAERDFGRCTKKRETGLHCHFAHSIRTALSCIVLLPDKSRPNRRSDHDTMAGTGQAMATQHRRSLMAANHNNADVQLKPFSTHKLPFIQLEPIAKCDLLISTTFLISIQMRVM